MNTYISASAWPSHLLCPSLNQKKGVTFHINKATSPFVHSSNVFVGVKCFWILTVIVPDPGLNENLASGPFGFLMEYPWSILFHCSCLQYFTKIQMDWHRLA